jgi:hypothetical protein
MCTYNTCSNARARSAAVVESRRRRVVSLTGLASVREPRGAMTMIGAALQSLDWTGNLRWGAVVGSAEMAAQENATSNASWLGVEHDSSSLEVKSGRVLFIKE